MKLIEAGTIKRIHVDKHILAHNRVNGTNKPAWTIQTSKGSFKASQVHVNGLSSMVQGAKPLSCGARMYIETKAQVGYE